MALVRLRSLQIKRIFWMLAGFMLGTLWLFSIQQWAASEQLENKRQMDVPGQRKSSPPFQGKVYNLEGHWEILPDKETRQVDSLVSELRNQTKDLKEQQWLNIQERRRKAIHSYCDEHKELQQPLKQMRRRDLYNFYKIVLIGAKHNALYCPVGKVACTSWKTALAMLQGHYDGLKPGEHIHDAAVLARNDIQPLTKLDSDTIIQKYPIFMFVRHPFERLVSAFKNKFQTVNKESVWLQYGIKIMKKYRNVPLTEEEEKTGWGVKFSEFLRWLLDDNVRDVHWDSYNDICHMCSVQYRFIGKIDTFQTDTKYILKHLFNTDSFEKFPHSNPSPKNAKTSLEEYFDGIPQVDIDRLKKRYDGDFKMFGYEWPVVNENL